MASPSHGHLPAWSFACPVVAWGFVALHPESGIGAVLAATSLVAVVFAAVHHAEVVAARVGEPFGSLVLALAVTVIEAGLILVLMRADPQGSSTLARDTVFAALMTVLNGIVGLCLVIGGVRHGEQSFRTDGTAAYLTVIAAMAVLTMVLPDFTLTTPDPTYTNSQLLFVATVSFVLYAVFVFVQTVRHRPYFLAAASSDDLSEPPSRPVAAIAFLVLLASLGAVVLVAKGLTPALEAAVRAAGAPHAVVGVAIAALVLMPEGIAAVRAAYRNRLQVALNLALGSVVATIGLTIPAVAILSVELGTPLMLGLPPKEIALLYLTLLVATLNLGIGRTTVLQGTVALVIFATWLFLVVVP